MTRVYAHRGDSGRWPENTLLAFREALNLGVDGIEFDLHASAEGIPVVLHDRALHRTTNGTGMVDETVLADLRNLDAGKGEHIPTFAEVLTLVDNRAHLDVEIKGHGIEEAVLTVLHRHPEVRWAISSFDWQTLRNVRALDSSAPLWPLAEAVDDALFAIASELASPAVAIWHGDYTAASAIALRAAGLQAMVWTVNDAEEVRRVRDLGAFALCSDEPAMARAALDQA